MNINDMQIRQPLVFWGYLEHCWTRVWVVCVISLCYIIFYVSRLGASGIVRIDESGDRDPDYSLKYYVNGSFQNIADYNHSTGGFNLRGETEPASVILLSH